ncbi:MAG: hypothetical protein R8G34_13985 [Paracoccaceae bacterium]|nr:hypothetical protein [Paracoccaceae bacterium]
MLVAVLLARATVTTRQGLWYDHRKSRSQKGWISSFEISGRSRSYLDFTSSTKLMMRELDAKPGDQTMSGSEAMAK